MEELRPEKGMIVAITFSAYETAEYGRSHLHDPRYLEAQEWSKVAAALNWEFKHLEIPCDMSYNDHDRMNWLSVRLGELRREVEMCGRLFIWVGAEGCAEVPEAGWRNGERKMEGPWIVGYVQTLPLVSHWCFSSVLLFFLPSFLLLLLSRCCPACWKIAARLLEVDGLTGFKVRHNGCRTRLGLAANATFLAPFPSTAIDPQSKADTR